MKILHVDTSITGPASVSRKLSAEIVEAALRRHPDAELTVRDLAAQQIDHLSSAHLAAAQGTAPENAQVREDIAAGRSALEEFLAADLIILGAPMYNFGIPSQLKAWIDRLAVPGATFRYTESGPEGLVGNKKLIIASSRGGFYGPGSPAEALDHQESYLRAIFGFFGITDVTVVRAEGVAISEQARATAIDSARGEIAAIAS
ncbi:FMN-dependent NADH-azoreductase [Phyllobacterium phragmitis]|uniref:FMN dependent NADH:quinone oxidoreductase n=1 Tax=Phyllobacterium phragmitis TaxID=2670329 RepID=A0A2S9IRD1_9HYPH|nr:FMN-dependent NADH-azoreductase [Phyllobacterium phragmitis]PRD43086.1 FMN-dependent NADH-azoreductase [Phyllobacterium phragmitis]